MFPKRMVDSDMNDNRLCRKPTAGCGLIVALLLCSAATALAQTNREDAISVQNLDGGLHVGTLQSLENGRLTVRTDDQDRQELDASDLLSLEFKQRTARELQGAAVLLDNGDRLAVEPLRLKDESIEARWTAYPDAPTVAIPLETVRAVLLHTPESRRVRTRLINQLLDRREESDVVVLKNDDQVTGELLEWDEQGVLLESAVGQARIDLNGIQAIGFDTSLISFPETEGLRASVALRDGTRLVLGDLRVSNDGGLQGQAAFGANVEFRLADVVSLQFRGGRAVFLSDVKPAEYRFTPYLTTHWELQRDRNVAGGPLRLRGVEYPKGLGMHSKSEVRYHLEGKFRRFQAIAGLDDAAGDKGSVTFIVEVDGRRVFESTPQTLRDPVLEIGPLDVSGAERLTLIVDYGDFGNIQDHANWCNPLLVR
jgi:hypothetical protein